MNLLGHAERNRQRGGQKQQREENRARPLAPQEQQREPGERDDNRPGRQQLRVHAGVECLNDQRRNEQHETPGAGGGGRAPEALQLLVDQIRDDRRDQESMGVVPDAHRPAFPQEFRRGRVEDDQLAEKDVSGRALPAGGGGTLGNLDRM